MNHKEYDKLDKIPTGAASNNITRGCLIVEGGAFRGMYNQGVMDALMQHDINFECVIGVSAGALAGMNYVSGQIGRSARANLGSRHNKNYIGKGALKRSHSVINLDFLLGDYNGEEPFDEERFNSGIQRFVAVAANCETGEAEYFERGVCSDMFAAIKASASMPYLSPMVSVDGGLYLDGGCSCKIPIEWAIEQGYEKIVVIRTREREYRKKDKVKHSAHRFYRKHPEFAEKLDRSNIEYNVICDILEDLENSGRIFVIAPKEAVEVSRLEGDVDKLADLYWQGYLDGNSSILKMGEYLAEKEELIDLHMHSACSDGRKSVDDLFQVVKDRGVKAFALTDHDTCDGVRRMAELAEAAGDMKLITGVEFSCLREPGNGDSECHILGYGFDLEDEGMIELQQRSLRYRKEKIDEMLDYLAERGIVLPDDAVARLRAMEYFGKPKMAAELINGGFCTNEQAWSKEYLDGFKTLLHPSAEETIAVIKAAGGVAIWAHPFDDKDRREDRESVEVFESSFKQLLGFGIQGLECCYSKYDEDEIEYLLEAADAHNLFVTGGSDYHARVDSDILPGDTGRAKSRGHLIRPFVDYLLSR